MHCKRGTQSWLTLTVSMITAITCSAYNVELLEEPEYKVIIGEEQTVIIPYVITNITNKSHIYSVSYIKGPNETKVQNFYEIRENQQGAIYLHFLQAQEEDLGYYTIVFNSDSKISIKVNRSSSTLRKEEDNLYEVFVYVLPVLFFVIALCAIAAAIVYVRHRIGESKPKTYQLKAKKNPYVKDGAGLPANQTSFQPESPQLQEQKQHQQQEHQQQQHQQQQCQQRTRHSRINTISREPSPPPVSKRTTSLHHINPANFPSREPPIGRFTQAGAADSRSINSADSWDDGEDEYENTCQENFPPKLNPFPKPVPTVKPFTNNAQLKNAMLPSHEQSGYHRNRQERSGNDFYAVNNRCSSTGSNHVSSPTQKSRTNAMFPPNFKFPIKPSGNSIFPNPQNKPLTSAKIQVDTNCDYEAPVYEEV